MKKLAVALSAALVMGLAAPAMAASGLAIDGELGSDFRYDKTGVTGQSYFDFNVALKGEGGDNVKAVIELTPWSIGNKKVNNEETRTRDWEKVPLADWSDKQDGIYVDRDEDEVEVDSALGFTVDKAYLQAEGAYWNGGPSLTTTIGDITLDQNKYVANRDMKGVMIEGIELGPVAAETFVTFDGSKPANLGLSARSDLQFAEVGGTVVRLDNGKFEFAADANTQIAGVDLSGEYAQDEANENAYKVRASVEPIEGVVLSGGYRGASSTSFAPEMFTEDISWTYPTNERDDVHDLATGFDVAVETTQFGTHLKASYDDPKKEAKIAADRAFQVAGLTINGEYEGTLDTETSDLTHELSANTTLNMIPQLQNVTLEGGVTIENSSVSEYNAAAKYSAPNGIDFGVHYDKEAGNEAEIYGTAGVSVKF